MYRILVMCKSVLVNDSYTIHPEYVVGGSALVDGDVHAGQQYWS